MALQSGLRLANTGNSVEQPLTGVPYQVAQTIRSCPYLGLRNIQCDYHDGVAILRGDVHSFYLKQIAQELVGRVDGIDLVDNRLQVVSHNGRRTRGQLPSR